MVQVWRDLLFAHWKLAPSAIRHLVPRELELDLFDGRAWITIAPFHMSIRGRGLPPLPGMLAVPELNCRTYVGVRGKPGVYFFSLDIASGMAAWAARTFYHLPYFHARMRRRVVNGSISYSSQRGSAVWRALYSPRAGVQHASPGTLDHFLTERYCLYSVWKGRTYRGEIHHLPWPLQRADAEIEANTIGAAAGIPLSGSPEAVSFARELKVLIWPIERLGQGESG